MQVVILRVERALRQGRELLAQHERLTARSKLQRQFAGDVFAQIEGSNRRSRQPRTRVNAVWNSIEISEKYGTLKERMAILMLADALLAAAETLTRGRPPLPRTSRSGWGHRPPYGGLTMPSALPSEPTWMARRPWTGWGRFRKFPANAVTARPTPPHPATFR